MFSTPATGSLRDPSGAVARQAILLAFNEINNKSDGIGDELLPNTQLRFAYRDSQRDDTVSLSQALALTNSAFDEQGIQALIGAASSSASIAAALVGSSSAIPQVSYASTSPLLSSGSYAYFARTVPSDEFQGEALADVLHNLGGYTRVAAISTTDTYGSGGITAFATAANLRGITVSQLVQFNRGATDFSQYYTELLASEARIIVIFMLAVDAGRFMVGAYGAGIGGPGFLWLGSDGVTSDSLWLANGVMPDLDVRLQVMRGYLGLTPSYGEGTAAHDAYVARLRAMPSTLPNAAGECNPGTDTDEDWPTRLWAADTDNNASSPLACAGANAEELTEDSDAPYAYDAVFAVAHALHFLLEVEGRDSFVGADLLRALTQNVSFAGITGTVEFYDTPAADRINHGDRRVLRRVRITRVDSVRHERLVGGRRSCKHSRSSPSHAQ